MTQNAQIARIGGDTTALVRPANVDALLESVRDHRPCTGTSHWTQAFAYFDWPIPVAKGDEIVQLDFSQSAAELTYLSTRSAAPDQNLSRHHRSRPNCPS